MPQKSFGTSSWKALRMGDWRRERRMGGPVGVSSAHFNLSSLTDIAVSAFTYPSRKDAQCRKNIIWVWRIPTTHMFTTYLNVNLSLIPINSSQNPPPL